MQSRLLVVLFCSLLLAGCGKPAPLASKNAKWFDFSDPKNAKPLGASVSADAIAKSSRLLQKSICQNSLIKMQASS
jgi:hypothetical protein